MATRKRKREHCVLETFQSSDSELEGFNSDEDREYDPDAATTTRGRKRLDCQPLDGSENQNGESAGEGLRPIASSFKSEPSPTSRRESSRPSSSASSSNSSGTSCRTSNRPIGFRTVPFRGLQTEGSDFEHSSDSESEQESDGGDGDQVEEEADWNNDTNSFSNLPDFTGEESEVKVELPDEVKVELPDGDQAEEETDRHKDGSNNFPNIPTFTCEKSKVKVELPDGSDGDEEEEETTDWHKGIDNFPNIPAFTGQRGLKVELPEDASAIDCFRLFFDDTLLKHIKQETNRYAAELRRSDRHKDMAIVKSWKTLTLKEVKGFVLILLHMGVVQKPSIHDYWSSEEFVASNFASRILSRDRFSAILSMLHFSDNSSYIPAGQAGHDPLYKIQFVYAHLQQKFRETYIPDKNVFLHEAICGWQRGKLRFNASAKDGSTARDIKLYELCEAQSGYVYTFEIHHVYSADLPISNRPSDVVLRMAEPLFYKGYHVFTNSYFSCPHLFEELVQREMMCTGTVRTNKAGMPEDLRTQKLQDGEMDYRRKGGLAAIRWRDKKDVNVLTSAHNPTKMRAVSSRHAFNKLKPEAVIQYDYSCMSGIDRNHQLDTYVPLAHRCSKRTTKLFMHLLTLSAIQASIILNKVRVAQRKKPMPLSHFMKLLGKELTEEYIFDRTPARPTPSKNTKKPQTLLRLDRSVLHYLTFLPPTATKAKPRRNCKVCYDTVAAQSCAGQKRKRAKETRHWCIICEIPLCVEPCFLRFHTKHNYIRDN